MERAATVVRQTKETNIELTLGLDGGEVVVDSGRPYLVFDAAFPQERVGDFDTCMTEEFFRALSDNAGFTLHLRCPYGKNSHHMIEALFKACAHALCDATAENSTGAVLSTKGTLSE